MKKLLLSIIIISFYLVSTAHTMDAKDSLKNDIRQYVSTLNHDLDVIDKTANMDSIKNHAADIHSNIDAFFLEIRRVYQSDKKDTEGAANLGIATALDGIAPGSGAYFQVEGINKLIHHTDNDKYFKKLDKVNIAAKKLQENTKAKKAEKLKENLAKKIEDLAAMQLK